MFFFLPAFASVFGRFISLQNYSKHYENFLEIYGRGALHPVCLFVCLSVCLYVCSMPEANSRTKSFQKPETEEII